MLRKLETESDRMARRLAEVNRRCAPALTEPAAASEQHAEQKRAAKKCRHLHKAKSHEELVQLVARNTGARHGLPTHVVRNVLTSLLHVLQRDLAAGDAFALRGVGVITPVVQDSKPRGMWRWKAAKMLRAEIRIQSSRRWRDRAKKIHRNTVEMEKMDAEARARYRLRRMGLGKYAFSSSIYRDVQPSAAKTQQQTPNK